MGVCITFTYILRKSAFPNPKSDFIFYIFKVKNMILVLDFEGGWSSTSLSYIYSNKICLSKSKIWLKILFLQKQKSDCNFRFWGGVGVCITFIYILMKSSFTKSKILFYFYILRVGGRLHHFHIYCNDIWLSKSKIWFWILKVIYY